jgi:hypothetical protein
MCDEFGLLFAEDAVGRGLPLGFWLGLRLRGLL